MRTAYIAVTATGAALAEQLANQSDTIFIKEAWATGQARPFRRLGELIDEIFVVYDRLVFIMAAGIVVRVIAPHIVHKSSDPAIVVIDERGTFVISLLSGHIGGANELAASLAAKIGAQPVITTATDVNNALAADNLAKALNLLPDDFSALKYINARLAARQAVSFAIDKAIPLKELYWWRFDEYLVKTGHKGKFKLQEINVTEAASLNHTVLITTADIPSSCKLLVIKPRGICAGIGCRRGVSQTKIMAALREACKLANVDIGEVTCMASTTVKADESGLLAAAKDMNIPINFWSNEVLNEIVERYKLAKSPFVEQQIGVGNVCEAAALQTSQTKKILLAKTKLDKVTVALAWVK